MVFLFVQNLNKTLAAPGTLETYANVQYICTLFRGEVLHQFDLLYSDVEGTDTLTVENIILGLDLYPFLVNFLSKQKCEMCHGITKTRGLKVRQYVNNYTDLNEYLASFPGEKLSEKIGVTELNEIFINSMLNSWSKVAYVQGFECEYITFKKLVSMFEWTEIADSIYAGLW